MIAEMASSAVFQKLRDELKGVDMLCTPNPSINKKFAILLKELYDASSAASNKSFGPFSTLTVDGMDMESLWEQIQTRNRPLLRFVKRKSGSILKLSKSKIVPKKKIETKNKIVNDRNFEDDDIEESEQDEEEMDGDRDDFDDEDQMEGDDHDDFDDLDESGAENNENDEEGDANEQQLDPDSENFLDDMNAWLDEAEEREELHERKMRRKEQLLAHKGSTEHYDSDDEEDDEMFVERELYENGTDENTDYTYKDFFAAKNSKSGSGSGKDARNAPQSKQSAKSSSGKKKEMSEEEEEEENEDDEDDEDGDEDGDGLDYNRGSDDDEDDEGDDDEDEDDHDDGEENHQNKKSMTSHQRHKLQLASQIKELEAELIGPKSWDLRGEVRGSDRPENSLLGITADIERSSKPAPIVTQEYTSTLEDMIRQRIKDEQFDDVTPPPPPRDPVPSESNDLFLSQERDRTGLGNVYAQEFLSKSLLVNKNDAETKKEEHAVVELKSLFHKICRQLDALSHFHYTPRPAVSEASVSSTAVPSISLEDITPAAESGMSASAPEEVHEKLRGKAAALLSDAELTSEDRKRLRRASKAVRKRKLEEVNVREKAASKVGKASKQYENKKLDEELRSDSRVIDGTGRSSDQSSYSNSATFFANMQSEAQRNIREKGTQQPKKSKKNQQETTSSRMKL